MTKPSVLIVDDEADIRSLLEISLSRLGLETFAAATKSAAKDELAKRPFSLCLTDMRLPDGTGLDIVKHIQELPNPPPVAVITAYGSMEEAVLSLKAGAFDFVTKPIDLDTLKRLTEAALLAPKRDISSSVPPNQESSLIGATPPMLQLRELISKVARTQAPVHIRGESGTGKELVARLIHQQGPRASGPFVPVNCGAIPSELMESEFFGHTRGSFTGATSDHPGLFAAAAGGTLFLDEVGDLPLHMQVKLLRALQERKIRPVGSSREIAVDVRVISATHKDLLDLESRGLFRSDLYYRLNVIEIGVPALRDRAADIPLLAASILARIQGTLAPSSETLSICDEALFALQRLSFPGNVRELENLLERAAALREGSVITLDDLGINRQTNIEQAQDDELSIDHHLEDAERARIIQALEATHYNKTKAARLLGITFRSLRYRLKKLSITD